MQKADLGSVHRMNKSRTRECVKDCYRCGDRHDPATCRNPDSLCHKCDKKGHLRCRCQSHYTSRPFSKSASGGTDQWKKTTGNGFRATTIEARGQA